MGEENFGGFAGGGDAEMSLAQLLGFQRRVPLIHELVHAAEREERANFQLDRSAAAQDGVTEDDGVFILERAKLLFHGPAVALIGPAGEGLVMKGAKQILPLGMDDAGIFVA